MTLPPLHSQNGAILPSILQNQSVPNQLDSTLQQPKSILLPSPYHTQLSLRSMTSLSLAPLESTSSRVFHGAPSILPPARRSLSTNFPSIARFSNTSLPDFTPLNQFQASLPGVCDTRSESELRQAEILEQIEKETKIKIGSENLLEALNFKDVKQTKDQKLRVEAELNSSNRKLAQLRQGLQEEILKSRQAKVDEIAVAQHAYWLRGISSRSQSASLCNDNDSPFVDDLITPNVVFSDILKDLQTRGKQPDFYIERANGLVELFRRNTHLIYELSWPEFGECIQRMLVSDSREMVATAYRVFRYTIVDKYSLQSIRKFGTDFSVVFSLVKQNKAGVEREQALKFVRAFLDVPDGVYEISMSITRVLVAMANHDDDRLSNMAVLTLAEMLVYNPPQVINAGGLGKLVSVLGEETYHASESIAAAFLYLLDVPARRSYLKSGHELEVAFASFTEPALSDSQQYEEKLRANSRVICCMMKSWSGLITLAANDFLAVRSLIAALYVPLLHVRNVLLELFMEMLRIKPPSWSSSFVAGRRLTTYSRVTNMKACTDQVRFNSVASNANECEEFLGNINLIDHYTALLLSIFLHTGLVDALLHAEEEWLSPALKRKTTLILGEVLRLASEYLPSPISAQVQVLPKLVQEGSKFNSVDRFNYTATIYQVDSVSRTLFRSGAKWGIGVGGGGGGGGGSGSGSNGGAVGTSGAGGSNSANGVNGSTSMGVLCSTGVGGLSGSGCSDNETRLLEPLKYPLASTIDEGGFRQLMLETQVLNTVIFAKWRWDIIQNIIEGPLLNPRRLDEALKTSKFIHRLLSFYRPYKRRFSDVKNTKSNQKYVKIGCLLVRSLLQNTEGVRYLNECKMIRQLAECLNQVTNNSTTGTVNGLASHIFSRESLTDTLSWGYFCILGSMSKDVKGLQILEKWKMFSMFHRIIELRDRDDLIINLINGMDYSLDGHLRIILSKAMVSASQNVRISSTLLLRSYATRWLDGNGSLSDNKLTTEWAIQLLVTQLYDPDIDVCGTAVKILEEVCQKGSSLEYLVKCRPALDHLGEIGAPLLLRFLSTSLGYHYLDDLDYINREMDDWFMNRNNTYVNLIESSLSKAFSEPWELRFTQVNPTQVSTTTPSTTASVTNVVSSTSTASGTTTLLPLNWTNWKYTDTCPDNYDWGIIPPHFYRELTRTEEGCKLLEEKGHFTHFVSYVRDNANEDQDPNIILKLKGCLWAIGNVGSLDFGSPFLDKSNVVPLIVNIAESSQVLSIRGTAFFVLGLISRSLHGHEMLLEQGWDSAVSITGDSLGYCIPLNLKKLFTVKPWNVPSSSASSDASVSSKVTPQSGNKINASQVNHSTDPPPPLLDDADPLFSKILKVVKDMGNSILSKRAANEFHSLKLRHSHAFSDPSLFRKVLLLLENYRFRLPVCRFIIDLFDKQLHHQIILSNSTSLLSKTPSLNSPSATLTNT